MEQQANGEPAAGPSTSPFAGLSLAVDAYTLDTAGGKRKLRSIQPDGSLDYDEPPSPRAKRTEALLRIWNEVPGGFQQVNTAKLRDADPEEEWAQEPEPEKEAESSREAGELMSVANMSALRAEVTFKLTEARNQLWHLSDLARCLRLSAGIPSDPPAEPVPNPRKTKPPTREPPSATVDHVPGTLPTGGYTTVPATPAERTKLDEAKALESAIATKAAALDDCVALIDAAVDELRLMNSSGERWADDIRRLHLGEGGRGQWAVVPKPDFYRSGEKVAKDVVIPYALDEAPPHIYMESLAAFDLDPRKEDLFFAKRTYRRLRVRLRRGGPGGPQEGSTVYDGRNEDTDAASLLSAAQLETLDENLFADLCAEALALRIEAAVVEPTNVMLAFGSEKLIYQLYDTREKPSPSVPYSPVCDALLAAARLGLLQAYKKRKELLVARGATLAHNASPPAPSPTSILVPIVHGLQFRATCRAVREVLAGFVTALSSAGLSAALVERHSVSDGADPLLALLTARSKIDVLGALFTVELTGCRGLSATVTAPTTVTIVTPRANFPLRDVDALAGIVRDTITEQLSSYAYPLLRDAAGDDRGVFFDELDGVPIAGAQGPVSITIPSPPDRLCVTVGDEPGYDSAEAAQSLEEWLADFGRGLATADDS